MSVMKVLLFTSRFIAQNHPRRQRNMGPSLATFGSHGLVMALVSIV